MSGNLDKKFWDAVNKWDARYKPTTITIRISSSFMSRARCKYCKGKPVAYFGMYKPNSWGDVTGYREFTGDKFWIQRFCPSWYKHYQPREFDDIYEFSFRLQYKNYCPLLHRTRGAEVSSRNNIIDCLSCECGKTVWAFNQESTRRRPEITNRKGRYDYPQKFVK